MSGLLFFRVVFPMQVSFSRVLEGDRVNVSLGQVRAATGWRAGEKAVGDGDREIALRALIREAEEYGADALVGVEFAVEEVKGADIEGVPLRRLTATGEAVRFKIAA
jgi:uncharacterized protein YbjQ (UPF0145 family)